jgi:hypothetical protein
MAACDTDLVNRPPHYTSGGVQCIEALESAMSAEQFEGFLRGNALKYLWRYPQKGGLQDLQKAQWYLARLIAHLSPDPEPWQAAAEHDPQAVAEAMTRLRAEHPAVEVEAEAAGDNPPVDWCELPPRYRYQTVDSTGLEAWANKPLLRHDGIWSGPMDEWTSFGERRVPGDSVEPRIWERPK